ncbi:ribonuclease Z, mitochondrial [Contarinia nasturtii]|uniref:ribonuclease Z, mitochondrial n=1 Tax=Contarinia nasturtii TaxID=265458 RepID=UPI0012D44783|nr:ribonuclease Z, mitochondrial [Contarinia nasturtii]
MSKVKLQQHIATTQKQLLKIKEKNQKYVPGTVNLQIVGNGAPGAPASVYLFTDQSRYLFNCGEGFQRLANEHKVKLTRLEHIFITRRKWHCIGGMPGLSLTIQDAGVPHITLHGPTKLYDVFRGMRRFVILKNLKVDAPQCNQNGFYDDAVLKIHYLPLRRDESSDDYPVMSFICECKPRPGALSLEKCLKLGVPKGPLLGKLKNGETLILDNGVTVRPEDVREPDDPGPVFLVIDIPSIDFLISLQNNEKFTEYLRSSHAEPDRTDLILHFSPASVVGTDEYKEFVESFPTSTQHLLINEQNTFSGYVAAHRMQWQLNQLNESLFPILKEPLPVKQDEFENCTKKMKLSETPPQADTDQQVSRLQHAMPMTCVHLRPRKWIDRSIEARPSSAEFIKEITDIDGVTETLDALKRDRLHLSPVDRNSQYPKIVFFGTGSCIPNKTRNVSSILVHTTKDDCILLDVGEGTLGQIYRFYGDESDDVIRKLKAVYISHLHADHHIGLFGIIQKRHQLLCDESTPILLFAPNEMSSWLTFYDSEIEPISSEFELIDNGSLIDEGLSAEKAALVGLCSLRTCGVVHCPNAFGVTMTINQDQPFKLTYSGDTKPCNALIELGLNSTLLIHEATMEDELLDDALLKMHSTTSQAIEQGHRMNAKYTLLTHFSQRYAKIPRIEQHLVENVGIAFDNMEVVLSDLNYLNTLYPAMKTIFTEHWELMEQKSIKRANKKAAEQSANVITN